MRKKFNIKYIVLFISLFISLFLIFKVCLSSKIRIDDISHDFVSSYLVNDNVTLIMKIITNLGSSWFLIMLTIFGLILIKNKKIGILISSNLIMITIINNVLKIIFQRNRPLDMIIFEDGYSFPSGHAMVSLAFYGMLIYLVNRYVNKKRTRIFLTVILSLVIIGIGFSRIYFGVHYVSDVLCGFSISICYLILLIPLIDKYVTNE